MKHVQDVTGSFGTTTEDAYEVWYHQQVADESSRSNSCGDDSNVDAMVLLPPLVFISLTLLSRTLCDAWISLVNEMQKYGKRACFEKTFSPELIFGVQIYVVVVLISWIHL